jgi:hypothetical protein
MGLVIGVQDIGAVLQPMITAIHLAEAMLSRLMVQERNKTSCGQELVN